MRRFRNLSALTLFAGLALAAGACGSSGSSTSSPPSTTAAAGSSGGSSTAAAPGSGSSATITVTDSTLGKIVVDGAGMTLYRFTPDSGTTSTCVDACADLWPAAVGPGQAGSGLEASALGVTSRPDGSSQITLDGHPLYTYAGDSAAGDTTGQGVGGKWYVVGADGTTITAKRASTTTATTAASGGY